MDKSIFKKRAGMQTMQRRRLIFYILGVSLPLLQFAIMYIYVNFDALMLSFQKYEMFGDKGGTYIWNGLNNFKDVFNAFKTTPYLRAGIWRGFLIYLFTVAQIPIYIMVAWYAVKQKPFATAAHIILYIPGILSSMVTASITKYALCEAAPAIVKLLTGEVIPSLLDSGDYMQTFWVILIDGFLMGVTANLLIYAGTMNSISDSVLEAAELDGVTQWQEFWHIYLPLISPTIVTFFILSLSTVLTADIGLFAYFGEAAPTDLYTVGYYMTLLTKNATYSTYPYLSALGMCITAIVIPLTIFGRKLCNRITRRWE